MMAVFYLNERQAFGVESSAASKHSPATRIRLASPEHRFHVTTDGELISPICILGMHRSGTSMVAGLLKLCGLDLGHEERLMGANPSNIRGHFEHLGFLEINDALLKHLGGSWDNPPDLQTGWENQSSLDKLTRQAQDLIATFSGNPHWGWKDPRTTILLPFWQKLIPNLRYVICLRNPLEVAGSLAKRDGISIAAGAELWNHYMCAAIRDTEGRARMASFYEDYFSDPLHEANRVLEFCGFGRMDDPLPVREIISAGLRHHARESAELLDASDIPLAYKLFYLGLRALSLEEPDEKTLERGSTVDRAAGAGKLLRLIDDFSRSGKAGELEVLLARSQRQLSKAQTILVEKENQIAKLEHENSRLQTFSDAVRRTWGYRAYRRFIKPLRGESQ